MPRQSEALKAFNRIKNQAVGNVLKQLRDELTQKRRKYISPAAVVKMMHDNKNSLDWAASSLMLVEKGKRSLPELYIEPICEVLGVTLERFNALVDERIRCLMPPNVNLDTRPSAQNDDAQNTIETQTASDGTDNKTHHSNIESQSLTELVYGREEDLQWLDNAFFPDGNFAPGKRCALTGLGGIGKTTLAIEYARLNAHRYRYCFFCLGASVNSLMQSYLDMADTLKEENARIRQFVEADRSDKEYIPNLLSALRSWLQTTSDYLLILDNADLIPSQARQNLRGKNIDSREPDWMKGKDLLTEEEFKPFLPNQGHLKGHILLTSRNAIISNIVGMVARRNLEELLPEAAETFLLKRTYRNKESLPESEKNALEQLVKHLYGLPLALEQAAAYMLALGQGFCTYSDLYNATPLTVLEKQSPEFGQYASTVGKTWLISFGAVQAESMASAEAFTLSAFLDPEAVPGLLLIAASKLMSEDGIAVLGNLNTYFAHAATEAEIADRYDNLLQPLTRYSLIKRNDYASQSFKMHRIVQAVRRMTLSADERLFYYNVVIGTATRLFDQFGLRQYDI